MIPDAALRSTPTSQYVYVIGDKNVLEKRVVTTGVLYEKLRRVLTGLKAGDEVVVEGNPMFVRQGATVVPTIIDARTFTQQQSKQEQATELKASGGGSGTSKDTEDSGTGSSPAESTDK